MCWSAQERRGGARGCRGHGDIRAYQAGDLPKTIELMDSVLRENPRDSIAYYLRGSARVDLGAHTMDTKFVRDGVADAREAIRFDTSYLPAAPTAPSRPTTTTW